MNLRKSGVGAEVHHAPVVTLEHEDAMWASGALGTDMPDRLLRTVFCQMELHCVITAFFCLVVNVSCSISGKYCPFNIIHTAPVERYVI